MLDCKLLRGNFCLDSFCLEGFHYLGICKTVAWKLCSETVPEYNKLWIPGLEYLALDTWLEILASFRLGSFGGNASLSAAQAWGTSCTDGGGTSNGNLFHCLAVYLSGVRAHKFSIRR